MPSPKAKRNLKHKKKSLIVKPPVEQPQNETKITRANYPSTKKVFTITVLGLVLLTSLIISFQKNRKTNTPIDQNGDVLQQSTQEAKLVDVYEKQKGVELKNFSPRYSVFENAIVGYRFAYPVGFNVTPIDDNAELKPTSGSGKLVVLVSADTFTTSVSDTSNPKDLEVLNSAAEFIKSTFEFTSSQTTDNKALKERFSKDNENIDKY